MSGEDITRIAAALERIAAAHEQIAAAVCGAAPTKPKREARQRPSPRPVSEIDRQAALRLARELGFDVRPKSG